MNIVVIGAVSIILNIKKGFLILRCSCNKIAQTYRYHICGNLTKVNIFIRSILIQHRFITSASI